jgi:hypothetical protein
MLTFLRKNLPNILQTQSENDAFALVKFRFSICEKQKAA